MVMSYFLSKYFFGFRGRTFKMNTNPKTLHCPNPRTCARTSCSLHGSLGQTLLAQAYKKPAKRDWSYLQGQLCWRKTSQGLKISSKKSSRL
jgi:hypothetical protein